VHLLIQSHRFADPAGQGFRGFDSLCIALQIHVRALPAPFFLRSTDMKRMLVAAALVAGASATPAKMEFDKYQLIILRTAPGARALAKEEQQKLMEGHLGHFRRMAMEGKLVVAGPFAEQDDKTAEGLCLYRAASLADARALAEADPAVKAGQLRVEAMTWYTEKGALDFPAAEKLRAQSPAR
jgi:uncharacterized protein